MDKPVKKTRLFVGLGMGYFLGKNWRCLDWRVLIVLHPEGMAAPHCAPGWAVPSLQSQFA